MTARDLLLARHGETDWNAAGRWQGQTDVPLNAAGRAQARALAERVRGEGIRAIATSDLARARVTAELVAAALGLEVALVDPGLREQGFGAFEGLTRSECEARFPEDWARHLADPHATPPGGEPRAALLARLGPAIARVAERLAAPALVVMHGGSMRALLAELPGAALGAPAAHRALRGIPNGGLYRVTVAGGRVVAARWLEPAPAGGGG